MSKDRSTKEEVIVRRKEVMGMYLKNTPRPLIIETLQSKYGLTESSAENELSIIRSSLAQNRNRNIKSLLKERIEKYEYLYEIFIDKGWADLAIACLKQKEDMVGLSQIEFGEEKEYEIEKKDKKEVDDEVKKKIQVLITKCKTQ